MCTTVNTFHQAGYIHGDIKPQNFVITRGRVRLIDFGIAKKMQVQDTMIIRDCPIGTPKYMAPEAIKSYRNPDKFKIHRVSDVWSIGVIVYELACGMSPFDQYFKKKNGQQEYFFFVQGGGQVEINWNINCSDLLKDLLKNCLEWDDTKRY